MKPKPTSQKPDVIIDEALLDIIIGTLLAAVDEVIEERVDQELLAMINGDGFEQRVAGLIDSRFQVMVTEISIQTSGAGPGRGHRGRTHKKISLSLPETLYQEAKELDGFFSAHVGSALELYLNLQKR